MQEVSPKLAKIAAEVLFGDVWERPELSKRDRSLIPVPNLVALYRTDQLRGHIGRALDNGVTKEEIGEIILHTSFYAGVRVGANAVRVAKEVFDERGI
ncbi:MAG: carboxymuconolactone decarboxylase family protein [Chloroflexi bacterium]|nr:carboxymuconolactone decarboxylase family protein [Chloroflexota bacterium]